MGDLADKLISLCLSLAILWQALVFRRIVGTWLAPACLFSLFWFVVTFVPLLLLFPVPVEPMAMAYILIFTTVFSLGALFFPWHEALAHNASGVTAEADSLNANPLLVWSYWIFTVLSLVLLVANSLIQKFTLYDLVFSLFESSARYAAMRNSGEITTNIFGQLSVVFVYVGVVLGGFVFYLARSALYRSIVVTFAFLPSLIVMVTQSAKGMFFLALAMFYGAILVVRLKRGETFLFSRGVVRRAILATAIVLPIVTISFVSRGLYESHNSEFVISRLTFYFASYTCGHLYAFSDWFAHFIGSHSTLEYINEEPSYGFYTFMPLFSLFGDGRVVPVGYFADDYTYKSLLSTNIFTMFRGLIQDFGLVGSMMFAMVSSVFCHLCFCTLLRSTRSAVASVTYIFTIGFIFTSFMISLLIWTSVYVVYVLLIGLLLLDSRIRFRGAGRRGALPPSRAYQL